MIWIRLPTIKVLLTKKMSHKRKNR